jgi:hypothetical protein
MKFNPLPWLLILVILCLSWWARRLLIEEQELAFFCEGGGQTLACRTHGLIAKIFYEHDGIGYFALFLGALAVIARSGLIGQWAGIIGIAGLILHNGEYAAAGFLLGVLTLARAQFEDYRAQHRTGQ